MLASVGADRTLLRDLSGSLHRELPNQSTKWKKGLRPLCFSRDGQRFAVPGSLNNNGIPQANVLTVVDLETGQPLAELRGHSRPINAAAFTRDGTRIATGSDDNLIKIWDVAGATELLSLRGHSAAVMALAFTPDDSKLVTVGFDSAVIVWDATPAEKPTWLPPGSVPPLVKPVLQELLARNPLYTGRVTQAKVEQGQVVILNLAGQRGLEDITPLAGLRKLRDLDLRDTRVSDLGPLSALPLTRLVLRETSVSDLAPLGNAPLTSLDLRETPVQDLSPLGDCPLVTLWHDPELRLDDLVLRRLTKLELLNGRPARGSRVAQPSARVLTGHRGAVRSVSMHPEGTHVISGGIDGTVRVWTLAGRAAAPVVLSNPATVTAVRYSPDAAWLSWATGDSRPSSKSGTVHLTSADRLTEPRVLAEGLASVECLAFTSDGRKLAAGSGDGSVLIWETASGELTATFTGHTRSVLALAFSPDNTTLATGTGTWADLAEPGEIRMWNLATGQSGRPLKSRHAVHCLSFLQDPSRFAVSNWNLSTAVLDATTGAFQFEYRGAAPVSSHALLEGGLTLVTVGETADMHFWDLESREKWATLAAPGGTLSSVSATADSRRIATAGSDGAVRIWTLPDRAPKLQDPPATPQANPPTQ